MQLTLEERQKGRRDIYILHILDLQEGIAMKNKLFLGKINLDTIFFKVHADL